MRRLHIVLVLIVIGLLGGCGTPNNQTAVEASATERSTAFVLPTETPMTQDAPAGEQTPPTPVPTTPAPEPTGTSTMAPVEPAAIQPTATTEVVVAEPTPIPPAPPAAAGMPAKAITIDAPHAGALVGSPLEIRGSANYWPFEATLVARLLDASGNELGLMPVMVQAPDIGQGGPWADRLAFTPPATEQEGTLEVFEASAKDGSIVAIATVKVRLAAGRAVEPGSRVELLEPAEGSPVALPLHAAVRGVGDESVSLQLILADGSRIAHQARADHGYIVQTLPGTGAAGPATLEVVRGDGAVLARRNVRVVDAAETMEVQVAWLAAGEHEEVVMQRKRVARSPQVASAALDELLWGPNPDDSTFATSLPSPAEVLSYSGRTEDWGARVRLLKLTITDGVALANFSRELQAYGGGATRALAIRQQIERTLLQFPSVKQVVIAVEGVTEGVLQP